MDVDDETASGTIRDTSKLSHDAERRDRMLAQLRVEKQRLASLPKNSQYVLHRMRVITRALEILAWQNHRALEAHEDELASLLSSLSL